MDGVAPVYFSIMLAKSEDAVAKEFRTLVNGLQAIDKCLRQFGEHTPAAPYFLGAQYSLAETLTAPFVVRLLPNLRQHRGIDLLSCAGKLGLQAIQPWLQSVCTRPSTVASMPAENSLLALAPYLQPFFEYHVPQGKQ